MAVLQRHAELVDAGLLAVMQQYAEHLDSQGNRDAAQWLLGLAGRLAEAMGITDAEVEGTPEDLEQFLLAVLQLVADSRGAAQQVYPFLAHYPITMFCTVPATATLTSANPSKVVLP